MDADELAVIAAACDAVDEGVSRLGLAHMAAHGRALLAEVTRLTDERDKFRAALVTISQWDCLNPPATQMCADLSWLKQLVSATLLAPKGEPPCSTS